MRSLRFSLVLILAALVWQIPALGQTADRSQISPRGVERITKEVRHELLLLPYYGVFDSLSYKVDPDGTVTLMGAVVRPVLKSDAENTVKKIEGVEKVVNEIKVLPLSPNDDQVRRAAFRAIYGSPQMTKYAWESVQSIHIIVDNGHITLEGVVDNQADKDVAGIQAKSVQGAFSVTNNLQVAASK